MPDPLAKKLLLIGWDAADWKIATPLMDQGLMPALDDLVSHGVMGNLATLRPILSPMLWNSIATGMRADKHGIHGFMEPDTHTGGVQPVTSTSRKVKAIWNILTQEGYRTHVLGWFAGHPAEPINGTSVSDLYPYAQAPLDKPWPLPPGAVHPESLRDTFAELRMHPAEVTEAAILAWIPKAAEIDQEKDKGLASFAKILAENLSIHNAATWILHTQPWDFMAVYYNGIDHFCHAFMHFHPPRMEGIPEDKFEMYKDVVNNAYRFHDMCLRTLVQLAGPETTVMLVSDHGFHSDHLRPRGIPNEPAGPAVQHRQFGVIAMRGPHIKGDERIYGATLVDVTPTILTLFGLPVGEDMDGRVLVQAFDEPPEVTRIPSWEQVPGECGMHPADLRMDPAAAQAVLQQFVALGYIQPPNENQQKAVEVAVREANYNLARVYLDSRRPRLALPLLEEIVKGSDEARFRQHLAQCHYMLGQRSEAKRILEDLIANPPKPPKPPEPADQRPDNQAEAATLVPPDGQADSPAVAAGDQGVEAGLGPPTHGEDGRATLHGLAAREGEANPAPAVTVQIGGVEQPATAADSATVPSAAAEVTQRAGAKAPAAASIENRQSAIENRPHPWAEWLMGVIHFEEGNTDEALACLLRAEQADPLLLNLHLRIGETYLRRQQLDDAERAFRRALQIDGDSAEAHLGLAQVHLRRRQDEDAAEESLVAVGLQHFLPLGHYSLGVALARLGHPYRATVAFETAVSMLPGLVNGHRWLAALHARPGGDLEKAGAHRKLAADLMKRRREQSKAVASGQ
jgi:predicted AlkP superfamily phosphohydrolase/phosphomutase/tetratricopeptide (TPR) repeat protein